MTRWRHAFALATVCLFAALTLTACGRQDATDPDVNNDAAINVYHVRGQITQLPGDAPGNGPGQEFMIRHEAIDEYRNSAGEIVGMSAMTMPFPPAPGVSLDGFEVGDKVRATIEVRWYPRAGWQMTAIEKLPPDTPLEFREAQPPHADHDHTHDHDHDDAHNNAHNDGHDHDHNHD